MEHAGTHQHCKVRALTLVIGTNNIYASSNQSFVFGQIYECCTFTKVMLVDRISRILFPFTISCLLLLSGKQWKAEKRFYFLFFFWFYCFTSFVSQPSETSLRDFSWLPIFKMILRFRGILVKLVICVVPGH